MKKLNVKNLPKQAIDWSKFKGIAQVILSILLSLFAEEQNKPKGSQRDTKDRVKKALAAAGCDDACDDDVVCLLVCAVEHTLDTLCDLDCALTVLIPEEDPVPVESKKK